MQDIVTDFSAGQLKEVEAIVFAGMDSYFDMVSNLTVESKSKISNRYTGRRIFRETLNLSDVPWHNPQTSVKNDQKQAHEMRKWEPQSDEKQRGSQRRANLRSTKKTKGDKRNQGEAEREKGKGQCNQ